MTYDWNPRRCALPDGHAGLCLSALQHDTQKLLDEIEREGESARESA